MAVGGTFLTAFFREFVLNHSFLTSHHLPPLSLLTGSSGILILVLRTLTEQSLAIITIMNGPMHPGITPALADPTGLMPFQKISADFVQINDLLDVRLQALNEEHYPNCHLPGQCHCRGRYFLVMYLGIKREVSTKGFNGLGTQMLQVHKTISKFFCY